MKPKRNDHCPCGSGKKFKKCCLELGSARALYEALEQQLPELDARELDFVKTVLTERAVPVYKFAKLLSQGAISPRYGYLDSAVYRNLSLQESARVYWTEMVERAHLACTNTITRSYNWLQGARYALESGNFLVFASSMRSLLESLGDSYYSLRNVASTFAEEAFAIQIALSGKAEWAMTCGEIENQLIHYSHGRRLEKSSGCPESHKTRSAAEYLHCLKPLAPDIFDIYGILCDITHPGYRSVALSFSSEEEGDSTVWRFMPNIGAYWMQAFCRKHSSSIAEAMAGGYTPALMTLRVINRLLLPHLHIPVAEIFSHPYWSKLESLWGIRGVPDVSRKV